jgi:pyruvate dehydrogenase E2 component (dihydrolipoamide acetyltransferase)
MLIKTPDLGVEKAEITDILVQAGDSVQVNQSLILVESAKASVEVPSPVSGVIRAVLVQHGQTISEHVPLFEIDTPADVADVTTATVPESSSTAAVTAPEPPLTAEPAPVVAVELVSVINPSPSSMVQDGAAIYAGPAVRRVARQLGVNLQQVTGTGPHQRLLKEDVYAYVNQRLTAPSPVLAGTSLVQAAGLPPLPDMSRWGGQHVEPLTRLQQAAIPQLALNQFIPQVTQFDQADITALEALRADLKADFKQEGISLTILAFVAKAVAHLLLQEPRFNSHLADDGQSIVVREAVHLGIAVATPDGLIVPVLRTTEQKGIRQIAQELQALGQKARDKKLGPNDLAGASFTISSLGNLGGTGFTPLVSWPQVAILGLSPAALQPVWDGQAFVPRLMLPLSLSYDHRVINGADAARFTRKLAVLLSDIRRLLL